MHTRISLQESALSVKRASVNKVIGHYAKKLKWRTCSWLKMWEV
uniref:Uncharacterized protein n=1 Tax=Anguilla anguilla TaxID=7936 RepID=A0A0E9XL44_ANGAN